MIRTTKLPIKVGFASSLETESLKINIYKNMKKNILKFDTVRFISSNRHLISYNEELFKTDVDLQTGEIRSVTYNSKYDNHIPFELYIHANYKKGRLAIEFSSKVLLGNYPQLICYDNFVECLQNINALGICKLDEEAILNDCEFTKLHTTKDVQMKLTDNKLNALNQLVGNYRRFKWERYNDTGITFMSDVKSSSDKVEITFYNKEVEIVLKKNENFLSMTGKSDEIKEYFNGKTRVEMRLETRKKIKRELGIPNTSWESLNLVQHNPLLKQFNKVFTKEPIAELPEAKNINEFFMHYYVKSFNRDLKKIEQNIKDNLSYNSRGALGKQMKKIAEVTMAITQQEPMDCNVLSEIRSLLSD